MPTSETFSEVGCMSFFGLYILLIKMPFAKRKIVQLTEFFCSFQRVLTFGEKNDIIMRIMMRLCGFVSVFWVKNTQKMHFRTVLRAFSAASVYKQFGRKED
jgi:hypothetical protein